MKLISISSWQRHLFRREAIDWSAVGPPPAAARLLEVYKLTAVMTGNVDQAGRLPSVSGAGGEFKRGDKNHTIEQFIVDPVSIQFQVTGDTAVANEFYEDILKSIETVAQIKINRGEKLTSTMQTMTVANLDIDPWKFYSREWMDFLSAKVDPVVSIPGASHQLWPQTFGTIIHYKREPGEYVLNPKLFTVEPRAGTLPEQGIYFVQSPTDSSTHFQLVEELERIFRKDSTASTSSHT